MQHGPDLGGTLYIDAIGGGARVAIDSQPPSDASGQSFSPAWVPRWGPAAPSRG